MLTTRALLVLVTICPAIFPQQSPNQDALERLDRLISSSRLKGRPLVQFVVLPDPKLAEFGMTQDTLTRDVELILRRNRVAIAQNKEDYPKAGILGITVDLVGNDLIYGVSVNAAFSEPATVLRTGERIQANVWHEAMLDIFGRLQISNVRDVVKEVAEKFALDYLRANPQ